MPLEVGFMAPGSHHGSGQVEGSGKVHGLLNCSVPMLPFPSAFLLAGKLGDTSQVVMCIRNPLPWS